MKKSICLVLLAAMALGLFGCAEPARATDLTLSLTPKAPAWKEADDIFLQNQMALALKLFSAVSQEKPGENVLISPLSIQLALAMTANGADGETLQQMQSLLGGEIPLEALNGYLSRYVAKLPNQDDATLHIANSIWYRGGDDPLEIKLPFLQTCADYYRANAYRAPFDQATVEAINAWVSGNTNGMIQKLVARLEPTTQMVLINALAFDARWQSIYTADDQSDAPFYALDGSQQEAQFLFSTEYSFLRLPNATGFVKNYTGGTYRFAALLPREGVSIEDLLASLSPEELAQALKNPEQLPVQTYLPKFSCEFDTQLNDVLCGLGMDTAFDERANFSRMADTDLYISSVIHKTYIRVDENGTKAAAVTGVFTNESAALVPERCETVRLDRPFVYLILDGEHNLPLFMGVVTHLPQ